MQSGAKIDGTAITSNREPDHNQKPLILRYFPGHATINHVDKKYRQYMTKRLLEELNIDEKTERVYRALLTLGDAPAYFIAKRVGLKRTSVYHLLESLAQMGLTSSYKEKGVTRFYAESPRKLKGYFESKSILAERLIPFLEKDAKILPGIWNIRNFEGKSGIQSIMEEALTAKDKTILSVGSSAKMIEHFGHMAYGARRRKNAIKSRSLRYPSDHPEFEEHFERHTDTSHIRYLPKNFNFPGMMIIFDSRVAIITYERSGSGVIITSGEFSQMMRSVFEVLWQYGINKK